MVIGSLSIVRKKVRYERSKSGQREQLTQLLAHSFLGVSRQLSRRFSNHFLILASLPCWPGS
jgi:hypothetical protein